MDRKLTPEQAKKNFPEVEKVTGTDTDVRGIINRAKVMEIVEKIGKYNIKVEGDNLRVTPNDWVKKNFETVKANKPGIMAYMAELQAERAKELEELEQKWEAEKAKKDAADKLLLDAMEQEAAELRTQVPEGHLLVNVEQTGSADGDPILEYTVDGMVISWRDINVIGWAEAIRPGALGSFASICVASISRERLIEIKAEKKTAADKAKAEKETETKRIAAIFSKAKETGEKQELERHTDDCNDPSEECNMDIVTVWAMPDGTKTTTRTHTW